MKRRLQLGLGLLGFESLAAFAFLISLFGFFDHALDLILFLSALLFDLLSAQVCLCWERWLAFVLGSVLLRERGLPVHLFFEDPRLSFFVRLDLFLQCEVVLFPDFFFLDVIEQLEVFGAGDSFGERTEASIGGLDGGFDLDEEGLVALNDLLCVFSVVLCDDECVVVEGLERASRVMVELQIAVFVEQVFSFFFDDEFLAVDSRGDEEVEAGQRELPEGRGDEVVEDAGDEGEGFEGGFEVWSGWLELGQERQLGDVPEVLQEELLAAVWLLLAFEQRGPVRFDAFFEEGGEFGERPCTDLLDDQFFEPVEQHCGREGGLLVEGSDGCFCEEGFEACEVSRAEAAGDFVTVGVQLDEDAFDLS